MSCPVVITGMGAVTALGPNLDETWKAVQQGACGLFPSKRLNFRELPSTPVGEFRGELNIPAGLNRSYVLAGMAAREASEQAGLQQGTRVAVVVGTTTAAGGGAETWYLEHLAGKRAPKDMLLDPDVPGLAEWIAQGLGLKGPQITVSTACASGAQAILQAYDMLICSEVDFVVAGGTDALCWLPYLGFSSLRLLCPEPCRPFDADRSGLSLGEAGAMLVLERQESAQARGARAHGLLLGGAVRCDAHHMTAPEPEGQYLAMAMQEALRRACITPQQVDYINAHGTGTPANDPAEAAAIRTVFGEGSPPVSSTKSMLGHTLGAAGALEAVLTTLALRDGVLPATVNTRCAFPDSGLDLIVSKARMADARFALSNSLAFGGNNVCLAFGRVGAV